MKIRAGFVSNSSSTSFLVIAKRDFNQQGLQRLMGVDDRSPLVGLFQQLYEDIIRNVEVELDMSTVRPDVEVERAFRNCRRRPSAHVIERLKKEAGQNATAYFGYLDSESSSVQTFFCTDSFEEENDELYINGLECTW